MLSLSGLFTLPPCAAAGKTCAGEAASLPGASGDNVAEEALNSVMVAVKLVLKGGGDKEVSLKAPHCKPPAGGGSGGAALCAPPTAAKSRAVMLARELTSSLP